MKGKKGAIELSMNTIVVVVIAIVLLSLGLVFVRKIMGEVTETSGTAFEAADKEIQELMGGDSAFFIPGQFGKEVRIGEKVNFNAGIQNFEGETINFKIQVEAADSESDISWVKVPNSLPVNAGEKRGFPIIVTVPKTAISGSTYMWHINIKHEDDSPYKSELVSINVK